MWNTFTAFTIKDSFPICFLQKYKSQSLIVTYKWVSYQLFASDSEDKLKYSITWAQNTSVNNGAVQNLGILVYIY